MDRRSWCALLFNDEVIMCFAIFVLFRGEKEGWQAKNKAAMAASVLSDVRKPWIRKQETEI